MGTAWRWAAPKERCRSPRSSPPASVVSRRSISRTAGASPWASGYLESMSPGSPQQTATPAGITDTRVVAAQIYGDLRAGEMLDASFDRRTARLDARDRRWTRELVYGSLRKRSILDAYLQQRVKGGLGRIDADLVDLLRLGSYQLLMMGSVPAYAAIGQTVELAKRRHGIGASKLVNAVLRQLDRDRDHLTLPSSEDPVAALALEHS